MPTKHIDDATAAQLDDLYVRCVTLTQQPVKEVEVLRLAIQTGIGNISDNDILASKAVKATVWERLAGDVWTEVTKEWPAAGIHSKNFNEMAERHSPLWKTFTSNVCRDAIRSVLKRDLENNLLNDLFGWSEAFTEEEKEREEKERNQKDKEYRKSLHFLDGRLYSSLSEQEQNIAVYYSEHGSFVSFTPDGKDDFQVQVQLREDGQ